MYRKLILTLAIFLCANTFASEKLLFAVDIIRHGIRTPAAIMPKAPYPWSLEPGQLLPVGLQQEFALGQAARQHYVTQKQLLPAKYDDSPNSMTSMISIHSTPINRTLLSAQAFAQGLYPLQTGPQKTLLQSKSPLPEAMNLIPVHSANFMKPADVDAVMNSFEYSMQLNSTCLKNYLKNKFSGNLERWQKATGFSFSLDPIKDIKALIHLGDNVSVRHALGIPLPAPLTKNDENTLFNIIKHMLFRCL